MIHRRNVLLAAGAAVASTLAWAGSYEDFFTAILRDDPATITALLRRGFDPNTRDAKGQVGLVIALKQESDKAFDALLAARNTQVEARNAQDESPLMMAAIKGNLELVQKLVERGADINREGWAPLHYAASAGLEHSVAIASYLLEHSAYIDAASPNGSTPLMLAAQYSSEAMVKLLLEEGADVSLRNQQGQTAVDFARRSDRDFMVKLLSTAVRANRPAKGKW